MKNLKHLVITFCPAVTDAAVAKLKQALPGIKVEYP